MTFVVELLDFRSAFINSMMTTVSGKPFIIPQTNQEYEEMHGVILTDTTMIFKSEEDYLMFLLKWS